jgi:hypothetical protein
VAEEHRVVILDVPRRVVERLPDAAQVGLAVRRARQLIARRARLRRGGKTDRKYQRGDGQKMRHRQNPKMSSS